MIGQTLYRRDARRWEPRRIVGETRTSWILEGDTKVSKSDLTIRAEYGRGQLYTEAQRDAAEWERAARPRLHALIDQSDAAELRRLAGLLGIAD